MNTSWLYHGFSDFEVYDAVDRVDGSYDDITIQSEEVYVINMKNTPYYMPVNL